MAPLTFRSLQGARPVRPAQGDRRPAGGRAEGWPDRHHQARHRPGLRQQGHAQRCALRRAARPQQVRGQAAAPGAPQPVRALPACLAPLSLSSCSLPVCVCPAASVHQHVNSPDLAIHNMCLARAGMSSQPFSPCHCGTNLAPCDHASLCHCQTICGIDLTAACAAGRRWRQAL